MTNLDFLIDQHDEFDIYKFVPEYYLIVKRILKRCWSYFESSLWDFFIKEFICFCFKKIHIGFHLRNFSNYQVFFLMSIHLKKSKLREILTFIDRVISQWFYHMFIQSLLYVNHEKIMGCVFKNVIWYVVLLRFVRIWYACIFL